MSDKIEKLIDEFESYKERGESITVEELCAEQPELITQLKARLDRLHALDAFMERDPSQHEQNLEWNLPNEYELPAGRFRPVRYHASGALGDVFVAEDEELGRTVALKRINHRQSGSSEDCRRFELEARITASLDHPGVVPVFGLGVDADARPVYAMRFIDGETMAVAIDSFHRVDGKLTRRNVSFQQLLRKFLSLCETLAYAHSRGVIHRDVKPANVMLGRFGETLLVDWGLAKQVAASDDASRASSESGESIAPASGPVTEAGTVKGSPAYMSPEQAEGNWDRIGPPSDIYNLGATLYHLLTNQIPFQGDTRRVIQAVRRGEFKPPCVVNPRVPRPLEAICLRAMSRECDDRYSNVTLLANDIENWLADDVVVAWSEPWWQAMQRWIRRHRTIVTTACAVGVVMIVSLLAATAVLSSKNVELVSANRNTSEALSLAEKERLKAEDSLKIGLQAVHEMLMRLGHERLAQVPEMQAVRQEVLEEAVVFLEGFADFDNQPALRRERGLALAYLGNIQHQLRRNEQADESYQRAIMLQRNLVEQFPADVNYVQDLGISLHEWGRHFLVTDAERAESLLGESKEILESLAGKLTGYELPLAQTYNDLGIIYTSSSRSDEGRASYERAVALRQRIADRADDEDRLRLGTVLAQGYHNLGNFYLVRRQFEAADDVLRKALEILEIQPSDPILRRDYQASLQEVYNTFAALSSSIGDSKQAEQYHRKSLTIRKELAALYPNVPGNLDSVARSHHNLGTLFITSGRRQEASEQFELALQIRRPLLESHPNDAYLKTSLAETTMSLGLVRHGLGDLASAESAYDEANTALEQLSREHPDIDRYKTSWSANDVNYGNLLRDLKRIDESLRMHQRSIERLEGLHAKDPEDSTTKTQLFNSHGSRANTLLSVQRYKDALKHCDQVVALAPTEAKLGWRIWRAPTLARVDAQRCYDEVRELLEQAELAPTDWYNLACASSLSAETAEQSVEEGVPSVHSQEAFVADCLGDAFDLLGRIKKSGFFQTQPDLLKSDSDLDRLERRRALVADYRGR